MNPAYQKPIGTRFNGTIANSSSEYVTDAFDVDKYASAGCSVQSTEDVTLWFLWGTEEDADDALPYGASEAIAGAAAAEGSGSGRLFPIPPGATRGRFMVANASGSLATVIADAGVRAYQ